MENLLKELQKLSLGRKRTTSVSYKEYSIKSQENESDIKITSYKFSDFGYKKEGLYPTLARGLFIADSDSNPRIAIRGYDKFFNGI
jgi:tRNA ligase